MAKPTLVDIKINPTYPFIQFKTDNISLSNSTVKKVIQLSYGRDYKAISFYRWNKFGYKKPIEALYFTGNSSNVDTTIAVSGPIRAPFRAPHERAIFRKSDYSYTGGIDIETYPDGNDLIYPNGIGYILPVPFFRNLILPVTVVDTGSTFVNPRNGNDVFVGGYGQDYIGSRTPDELILAADPNADQKNYGTHFYPSTASGSKFYVGGSWNDVLDGGKNDDFLVGDRFNNYELYIPSTALSSNSLGEKYSSHTKRIQNFQPKRFKTKDAQGNKILGASGGSYPLWSPGGDVIRGYAGDDTIYGDDNSENNLAYLSNYKKFVGNTSYGWGTTLKLGNDFIDAGEGNDQIYAGFGSDAIIGGPGIDTIFIGDQILAPGYDPLFGPKIVFGDSRNTTNSPYPDIFVIGGVYSTEKQIKNSTSGISDTSQLKKTLYENVKGFETTWKLAKQVVGLIPYVGKVLKALGTTFFEFAKYMDKQNLPSKEGIKPLDGLTVIKDFSKNDQLIIKLQPGETARTEVYPNFIVNTNGYSNPLLDGGVGGKGTMLIYGKGASETYERVFLRGYTGNLYELSSKPDNGQAADGSRYLQIFGSDYGSSSDFSILGSGL